jgi:Arc/MetJ-type ribon-helix-helix transcriptional regulator
MRKKTDVRYDTIKIPEGLTDEIDKIVLESRGNFTSRTDVIKYAVRRIIDEKERRREYEKYSRRRDPEDSAPGDGLAESKGRGQRADQAVAPDARAQSDDPGESRETPQKDLGDYEPGGAGEKNQVTI